jgi:Zn-dependent protease
LTSWRDTAYIVLGLLIGVILHEYMHGRIADWRGDHTARNAGRLTLNPIPHIDPFGTILLPLGLLIITRGAGPIFGYAKPVPINPYFMKKRRDIVLVSLAGPLTNFTIAAVFTGIGAVLHIAGVHTLELFRLFFVVAQINIILGIFNLIPIPPLDGSKVLEYFLPASAQASYERITPFGFIIILLFLWLIGPTFFSLLNPLFRQVAAAMGLTLTLV